MAIKKRLGEMLVDAGIIDDDQLNVALRHQRQWGGRLGGILVELKLASEEAIVDALALKFGFEIARLDRIEPYAFDQARALVPHDYAVRHRVFPMAADTGLLVVAMSDPTNLALTDELAFKTGRRVKVCIAGDNAIGAAIRAHFGEDVSQREAIALEPDDDGAMEAVYDPIGATSSEQLTHLFEQGPSAPVPSAVAAQGRGAATRVSPAAHPPAAPAPAARPPAPAARAAVPPAARPPARADSVVGARERSRQPLVLQLEDQPTGSLPLDDATPVELPVEELQPIPLEPEAELEPAPEPGQAAYPTDAGAYPADAAGHATEAAGYTTDPAGYASPDGAGFAPEADGYATPDPAGHAPDAAFSAGAEWPQDAGDAGAEAAVPRQDLTEQEVEILAALDRFARGDEATPSAVSPAQLLAALIRLMLRKQWISEHELLDEILRG